MATDGGEVPAGWYPDPLGLPQLRWWDGKAWTEFTSDFDLEPAPEDDDAASSRVIDVDEGADDDGLESTFAAPPRESFERVVEDEAGPAASDDEPAASDAAGEPGEPARQDGSGPYEPVESTASDPPAEPEPTPEPEPAPAPELAVVPEPFGPAQSDPFAAAEANALVFTSRRARRAYERKLALESGAADGGERPYSRLDTNPVDIQLTGAASPPPADRMPPPAVPQAADPEAPTAGTPLDGREDLLAQSTLAPARRDGEADAVFSFESTRVSDDLPPARTLTPKRTYTAMGFVLAAMLPLTAAAVIALLRLPGFTATAEFAWAICGGALLIGVLLAFLDSSTLQRAGHERTASPLWALLTPIVYLPVRSTATRRETGHGSAVVLALLLGVVLTGLLVYLIPDLLSLVVPGVTAPWTSPLG